MLGSLGIDFTKWLPNATNEGETQVGDAKTIKISGKADVKQVIADLEKVTEKASALNVPGAGGRIPQKLTPEQKAAAEAAIKSLTVDVYTGADDTILRRLTVNADLQDAASKIDAGVLLDSDVHEGGSEADDHRSLQPEALHRVAEGASTRPASPISASAARPRAARATRPSRTARTRPTTWTSTPTCIEQAKGDAAKARKCADLLPGWPPHRSLSSTAVRMLRRGERRQRLQTNLRQFLFSGQGWPYLLVPFIAIAIVLDQSRRTRSSSSSPPRSASCRRRR